MNNKSRERVFSLTGFRRKGGGNYFVLLLDCSGAVLPNTGQRGILEQDVRDVHHPISQKSWGCRSKVGVEE